MTIHFSESCILDLENISSYYSAQGVPDIGINLVTKILKHIKTLSDHPSIGRVVPEFEEENIRELIHPPFRIVYLREVNSIQVIRVWRSERLLKLPDTDP